MKALMIDKLLSSTHSHAGPCKVAGEHYNCQAFFGANLLHGTYISEFLKFISK